MDDAKSVCESSSPTYGGDRLLGDVADELQRPYMKERITQGETSAERLSLAFAEKVAKDLNLLTLRIPATEATLFKKKKAVNLIGIIGTLG